MNKRVDASGSEGDLPAWSLSTEEILDRFGVSIERGLTENEAHRRRQEYGQNVLRRIQERSLVEILVAQFKSLVVGLLAVASLSALLFGQWLEGLAIGVVLGLNAAIGFTTELRAVRSMEALRELSRVDAVVRRDGQLRSIVADDLVPGDIVQIEAGDIVSADVRLVESNGILANESALTGESTPIEKSSDAIPADTPLPDRKNMLFKGTGVSRGSGLGVVVSTGMSTELGRISELVEQAEQEITPLEQRLSTLGRRLVWLTLGIAVIVALLGYLGGEDLLLIIETAIALAVAAVPEGLPIIATIAMARGIRRMAQRNALIRRLSSVETLGATTVICTDKTGTLTENRLVAVNFILPFGEITINSSARDSSPFHMNGHEVEVESSVGLERAITVSVLCNDASLGDDDASVGDPLDVALLELGRSSGIDRSKLLDAFPEVRESAFDPDIRMMATVHSSSDGFLYAVKGAPEAVLDACSHVEDQDGPRRIDEAERVRWQERSEQQAADGLRMLALAYKHADNPDEEVYDNLTFLGLVGFLDPARDDIHESITACQQAGITVVMVTGDHPATAAHIAKRIGLVDDTPRVVCGTDLDQLDDMSDEEREQLLEARVFARITPEQ